MPSKFSCRQLRETGQSFESFLVVRGLDMETDRERLRTIYNRDFKISLASSKSILQSRCQSDLKCKYDLATPLLKIHQPRWFCNHSVASDAG